MGPTAKLGPPTLLHRFGGVAVPGAGRPPPCLLSPPVLLVLFWSVHMSANNPAKQMQHGPIRQPAWFKGIAAGLLADVKQASTHVHMQ